MKSFKLKTACSVFIFSFILFVIALMIHPLQSAWSATSQEILEGAKKEGKLLYYSTMALAFPNVMAMAFEKKYPFIKVEIFRQNNPKMLARIESEASAGKYSPDVISIGGFELYILKKKNLLAKYISPESAAILKEFKDPEGYWTSIVLNPVIVGYNTNLVPPKDMPHSYHDFLAPKWKGKVSLDLHDVEWFANMLKMMGPKEGPEYMRNFAKQDYIAIKARTTQNLLMAAGEFPIGLGLYVGVIEELKQKGAPIDWVALDPVVTKIHAVSLPVNPVHPNAARLFLDFLLSKEGQDLISKTGRVHTRSDIPLGPNLADKKIKFRPSDISMAEDYDKYFKLLNEIFRK